MLTRHAGEIVLPFICHFSINNIYLLYIDNNGDGEDGEEIIMSVIFVMLLLLLLLLVSQLGCRF